MDSDGLTPLPNGQTGLNIIGTPGNSASNNTIGGTAPGDRNYVANSITGDIAILGTPGSTVTGNRVIGNYSGVNINGELDPSFTNGAQGVFLGGDVHENIIGGPNANEANLIAGNAAGIYVMSGFGADPTDNSILGNSIYSNTSGSALSGLGIDQLEDTNSDLVADVNIGVNNNDVNDGDSGPNDNLNYPIVSGVNLVVTMLISHIL